MKVIASSLRKGNVVDMDGRLYVVLTAQNIHPGKGTPVTQLDMRRISDGVKVSERYRKTEQVERAFVEDREHTFLYRDGEGFHFMNPENYDQVVVPEDILGDQAVYLQEGMPVMLSSHNGVPRWSRDIRLTHHWRRPCFRSTQESAGGHDTTCRHIAVLERDRITAAIQQAKPR